MKLFDLQNPFFKPLWLRVLLDAICLGWAVFEFVSGAPFWAVIFAGMGLYAAWEFFFAFDPDRKRDKDKT